ncbi:Nif3-like dinuclear metal center hexameric protein [Tichowtungia aerotolerans]|uniref:GTP cyclohydrolase 1 type 2 homolog n=1 Tax=Tichowtungia aerotolerans TaxID=2697043 RepID=A0A6P1M1C2_9BACT|nr:Nif3-like dinuclear metal center hexameric protein [Tichowtungia aerotolerans]QHI68619.1 Nif3-like dinuclear metal center hexameric protein [Tichowtungia aerotolerans]
MKLKTLIQTLEEIAPLELAESWDNPGLLIEPLKTREISKVLLAVDLTDAVAREAVQKKADAIVTYHPLFFGGFQKLQKSDPQAHSAMRLIQHDIAVYSPHTALDAAPGGVNDWLADSLGEGDLYCAETGGARIVELAAPVKLPTLGKRIREFLHINQVQTAQANDRPIKTIALCAGAGISALKEIKADCYLTGEMKHHDVLDAVERGTSVILCGHTETERGYLKILRRLILTETEKTVEVILSRADTAPLKTM